jgi:hypothetical protein
VGSTDPGQDNAQDAAQDARDQKMAALNYVQEAWAEARLDGVDDDCMAMTCLFAAFAELVSTYGEEAAAQYADSLSKRIRNGEFTLDRTNRCLRQPKFGCSHFGAFATNASIGAEFNRGKRDEFPTDRSPSADSRGCPACNGSRVVAARRQAEDHKLHAATGRNRGAAKRIQRQRSTARPAVGDRLGLQSRTASGCPSPQGTAERRAGISRSGRRD